MRTYLGIDGGGTKTAFALADEARILATAEDLGCYYEQYGMGEIVERIASNVRALLEQGPGPAAGVCLGLPGYGETPKVDETLVRMLEEAMPGLPLYVVNDVQVGWAGSLALESGVHIVSGTGSIAFACDDRGDTRRCGGWHSYFSDEGSCGWLGRETMGLFAKQADGRSPRGPLYAMIRESYGLADDFEFIDRMSAEVIPYRDRVAAMQRVLAEAAMAGDQGARALYCRAARELADMVRALTDALCFEGPVVRVSYSGGLFKTGALILEPLAEALSGGYALVTPRGTPLEGAVWLARQRFGGRP